MTDSISAEPRTVASPRRYDSGVTLTVIVACQLMMVLDNTVVTIALPQIQSGLHFSATSLSWVMNTYVLAFGGLMLLGGRAGDILGRRTVFLGGVAVFTVASLVCGIAGEPWLLLVARTVQGVAAAFASPAALALVAGTFEGERRTRALAVYAAVSSIGWAVGMIVGGLFTSWLSWRWVFFINIPLGIAVLLAAPRYIKETARHTGRFDGAGALTSTLGIAALAYALIQVAADGWSDPRGMVALAAAVLLLAAFALTEARAAQPITPLRLFADRGRSTAYLARMCINGSMMGMFFFLTQFLQKILGYSALRAGLAFVPIAVAMLVATRVAPKLVERFGRRWPTVGAALALAAGMLWLSRVSSETGYLTGIVAPLVLGGLGMGIAFVVLTMLALEGVAPADTGAASGLVTVTQQLGGAIGMSVLVTAFGLAGRGEHGGPDAVFTHGVRSAFLVATLLALLGAVAVVAGIRGTRRVGE
ncbi:MULTISPECIES: MFS transporter [Thermomonosporaceae]|uniref:MFS transporter n=1 Tax=Thermomonosporaceae TaxID=2012 RepID=UPI00255AE58A|nr:MULTISPECIES: MFS transporter [Thermomonosporaceae]MDL4771540.1 MFS transporter [Actinomadura xylanilytica]